jgi:hypothetical protein
MIGFTRRNHGKSHSYYFEGTKIPGVTSVIGVLDKPALVSWAARESAAYAVEHWAWLSAKPIMERAKLIEDARWSKNKKSIDTGHRLHAIAEAMQHGRSVDVDPEHLADVEAIARLLDQWQVESVATELPVCHQEAFYAGTADVIASSPSKGLPLSVWDFKTGKAVYSEVALQLAAYARATHMLRRVIETGPRGGKKESFIEEPMVEGIDLERGFVVHVHDGVANLFPVQIDDSVNDAFLSLLDVWWTWHRRVDWNERKEDHYAPPVGEPMYSELTPTAPEADEPPF